LSSFIYPDKFTTLPQVIQSVEKAVQGNTVFTGSWGSSSSLLLRYLREKLKRNILILTSDPESGDEIEDDFDSFSTADFHHFPPWDVLPTETDHLEYETLKERLNVLRELSAGPDDKSSIVIAPITAVFQPTLPPDSLSKGDFSISKATEISPEGLSAFLTDAGLEQSISVEEPGFYCRRGGIIDVFPLFGKEPFRIEFFGDTVDAIFIFDPVTQRSLDAVENCVLVDVSADTVNASYSSIKRYSIFDHMPENTIVFIIDPQKCIYMSELYLEGYKNTKNPLFTFSEISEFLMKYPVNLISELQEEKWPEVLSSDETINYIQLGVESMLRLEGSSEHAMQELKKMVNSKVKVTVFCHNQAALTRFKELLLEEGDSLVSRVNLSLGRLSGSFSWPALKSAFISGHEIFHRYHHRPRQRRHNIKGSPIRDFSELRIGDYVVHIQHGIAKFEGMSRLTQNGQEGDYMCLLFAGDVKLYVPLSHIELVQKYIGGKDTGPALSKLGGKSWASKKSRAEKSVKEAAADLLRIQAVRRHSPGIAHNTDNEWQKRFEDEFIFDETEDQLNAISELKQDMKKPSPMDRLLCGDVGFGKTEVSARAAFTAVMSGYQVAILVPTTILAEQHYRTFSERTADYPVSVDVISRFKTASHQRKTLNNAKEGKVDILIGTHRILSKDVEFSNLGLVIVDEEQRFGVEHKERLKHLRTSVDVLTMTATPIPRTLHMGLMGLRDISTLTTPPFSRQAIRSQVVRYDNRIIRRAVLRELSRGGQLYFVHNRVYNIDKVAASISELVPEAKIGIAHGQMNEHELEDVMMKFIKQKIDILVATTIIESGLDIPNVNTIFINDADHFGLSELHQLRGRVGRYRNRAYAYFLVPQSRPLSVVGKKRLKAIEELAELGAGFQIAMRDLEIRGAGNIIGLEQSGHIQNVGYELYCKLLDNVVKELNGEKVEFSEPVEFELGTHAYIPETYITLDQERLKVYRDLANCEDLDSLEVICESLNDRFGDFPESVKQLIADEITRIRARKVGINYLGTLDRAVILGFTTLREAENAEILSSYDFKGRKLTTLTDSRYRFGLGYYEEEWDGYQRELVETALRILEKET
jgi:transcription-repair coupling factor (superfamily II helicase)